MLTYLEDYNIELVCTLHIWSFDVAKSINGPIVYVSWNLKVPPAYIHKNAGSARKNITLRCDHITTVAIEKK